MVSQSICKQTYYRQMLSNSLRLSLRNVKHISVPICFSRMRAETEGVNRSTPFRHRPLTASPVMRSVFGGGRAVIGRSFCLLSSSLACGLRIVGPLRFGCRRLHGRGRRRSCDVSVVLAVRSVSWKLRAA